MVSMDFQPSMNASGLPPEGPQEGGSIDLRWLLGVPLRQWKFVIVIPLLSLLAAQGILKALPSVYQASVDILIFDPQQRDLIGNGQQQSARDFDTVAINTEMEVMKSQAMLLRVVKDLKLDENPEFQLRSRTEQLRNWASSWMGPWLTTQLRYFFGASESESSAPPNEDRQLGATADTVADQRVAQAAAILSEHVTVGRLPLAYIVGVSAKSENPVMAQRLATTIVDVYFADQQKARQKALDQLALWLTAKISDVKARAMETGTAIEKIKAENGFSDTGKDTAVERQIADLNTQLMAARADAADKAARLEQARQLSANSASPNIPDGPASSEIAQLRLQQSLLTQQQAQLRDKFGAQHVAVIGIAAQLARINQAISDEATRMRDDLQNSHDIAVRRQQSLEAEVQRLTAARGNSTDYVKLQELQRAADANSKVYDAYVARFNEIESSKSMVDTNERIISKASVPLRPISPRGNLILLGGGGLGVVLGLMIALAVDFSKAGMKMGADAEQAFGYPVVGNVPLYRQGKWNRQADSRALAQSVSSAPLSPFSEAVRTLRLGLRLSNTENNPKVILVTSSLAGEGKSTIATLLAASSAAAGQRTILVDCDVRGRGISRDFATDQPGLTDLLSGRADLATVTVHSSDIGCSVIPAGTVMRSPGDLLASGRTAEIMARLRADYDYVVVDTPPLLSVIDALALATIADKIIVAIDGRNTRQVSVNEALRLLRPESGRIAGIVFNKVAPEQLRRYGMYPGSRYYT